MPRRPARILNIIISVIFLIVGIYLNLLFISANKYPPVDQSVIVDLPFEGTWIATGAGASILTNHHDRIPSQKYAIDISRVGKNGKLFNGAEESNTYGAEILSPVDGKVVYIIDTLPDHPVRERDKLAGNHIVIQFHDTLYAALAHLQPYSIPLKVGDNVQSGALIGKAGMSGNTDICHLHIHIQDGPVYNIETSKTYPIRFKKFQRKRFLFWHNQEDQYLLSNDWVKYPVDQ
ncbi:MAG: M23 family metallopeptidase [Saprospiraceae bacterium]|nr:M23 family metallopeptidase [Saprospiraceae bacterium]